MTKYLIKRSAVVNQKNVLFQEGTRTFTYYGKNRTLIWSESCEVYLVPDPFIITYNKEKYSISSDNHILHIPSLVTYGYNTKQGAQKGIERYSKDLSKNDCWDWNFEIVRFEL